MRLQERAALDRLFAIAIPIGTRMLAIFPSKTQVLDFQIISTS